MKEYYSINENKLLDNYYKIEPVIEHFEIFRGPKGNKGSRGYTGGQGQQGLQGERGYRGIMGETGDRGEVGFQGLEGDKGVKGQEGTKGDTGARGFEGNRGEKGVNGLQGPLGYKGKPGPKGYDGRPGYKGLQGDRGAQGITQDTKIELLPDENSTAAWDMHGFYGASDANVRNESASGNHWRDPKRNGDSTPAIKTNYRARLEAQCPYNGFINAFTWWTDDGNRGYIVPSSQTRRITDTNHWQAANNIGLPYRFRVDCKVVKNSIPKN